MKYFFFYYGACAKRLEQPSEFLYKKTLIPGNSNKTGVFGRFFRIHRPFFVKLVELTIVPKPYHSNHKSTV
ncbi:hypothetical protein LEP1GSC043_2610 [Leptospira weilii str. Ecochallenge]|uniref:Uncharacterized protein n=1 Tax=Leptospira weilii str. Ecochallenge TaxID=1049986 RepID=N1TYN7_9LEPT|nr:hypothetical protein LEP1GSC043_2610 [Leptospira weilii str. Ecochallenge]